MHFKSGVQPIDGMNTATTTKNGRLISIMVWFSTVIFFLYLLFFGSTSTTPANWKLAGSNSLSFAPMQGRAATLYRCGRQKPQIASIVVEEAFKWIFKCIYTAFVHFVSAYRALHTEWRTSIQSTKPLQGTLIYKHYLPNAIQFDDSV